MSTLSTGYTTLNTYSPVSYDTIVVSFSSGGASVPWTTFHCESKPRVLMLTPQSGYYFLVYNYDQSTATTASLSCQKYAASKWSDMTGGVRFCYICYQDRKHGST